MTTLKELRFSVSRVGTDLYRIHATLREQTPYPPDSGLTLEGGIWADFTSITRNSATGVLSIHALLPNHGFRRTSTRSFIDGPPWQGLSAMPEAIIEMILEFSGEAYRDTESRYRFVVQSQHTEVLEFPWQAFLPPDDGFHGGRIAFLARYPLHPDNPVPFHLPLSLDIRGGMSRAQEFFDDFTLAAINAGAFEVQDPRASGKRGELVHIQEDFLPRAYLSGDGWPRLLVLQVDDESLEARRTFPSLSALFQAMKMGAGAVLRVSGPRMKCQAFFQAFYRKLLHNLPLEECVREALLWSRLRLGNDLDVLLMVRAGGEYGLLLSQGVVEEASQTPGRTGDEQGSISTRRTSLSTPRSLEVSRILDSPLRLVRSLAQQTTKHALSSLGNLASRPFDAEAHDLRMAVSSFRDLQRARRVDDEARIHLETASTEEHQGGLNRLLNVRLEKSSTGAPLDTAIPLEVGDSVSLHVNIAPARLFESFATGFPEEFLAQAFAQQEKVELDVCIFHDGKHARVAQQRGTLSLPRHGASTDFGTHIHVETPGLCRLRVGIYHRNTLLQSVVVEAWVLDPMFPEQAAQTEPAIRYALDYVASSDLLLLDEHSRPALSILTNRAADGNLWIGIFSDRNSGQGGLRTGCLHSFSPAQLTTHVQNLREALQRAQGTVTYKYAEPLNASNRDDRAQQFVQIAKQGWRLFDALFNSNQSLLDDEKDALDEGLKDSGTIAIARCSLEEVSIPWAAIYDFQLDLGSQKPLTLCPVFLRQLAEGNDLLDEPDRCRAHAACPLQTEAANHTVCPLGFWGIRHQLEQPLKQLKAKTDEEVASLLTSSAFTESTRLPSPDKQPSALMGYGSNIPGISEHSTELTQLLGWRLLSSSDRDEVVRTLANGPTNLFYLFCHGVIQGSVFKLQLPPATIEAADLQKTTGRSPFLVFLNACDSMATLPEVINPLLGKLTRMGALAVIGSEIKINNLFARPFARQVLMDFLEKKTLGESFMAARRQFLRSLNPLGLAYTLNSPVNVHLHGEDCARCRARV